MEVPANYNLKTVAFGIRRQQILENAPPAQFEITLTMFQRHPKVIELIKNYSIAYSEFEVYCSEIGFNECDENNIFAPNSLYVIIQPSEYKVLKSLAKPSEPRETIPDELGNIAKISGSWVMFNGTKYWMSFFTLWANPNVPQQPPVEQAPKQQAPSGLAKIVLDFDKDTVGIAPSIFEIGKTGRGTRSEWSIKEDPTAPSPPNVIAQSANEAVSFHFPYALLRGQVYKDATISVRFKAISGSIDQAAGIIFRFVDADNYYVLRANALENNVILFKYVKGTRTGISSASVTVSSGTWHELRAIVKGETIQGFLDGMPVIEFKDSTYKEGMVGMWTKADAVTYFDNFTVEVQ